MWQFPRDRKFLDPKKKLFRENLTTPIQYEFDQKVSKNANGGYLMGMQIEPTKIEETKKTKNKKNTKNINDLHEKLGHTAEEMAKLTGNYMKLSIQGKMENCENCAIRKM